MKNKIGFLMIVVTLLLIVFTMSVAAQTCSSVKGDLNYDGAVDELDVEVIQHMITGSEPASMCADFDNDSAVAPGDMAMLRGIILENYQNNVVYDKDFIVKRHSYSNYYYIGDVNLDGKADYQDAGIIPKMITGAITPHPSADIDRDGAISPADLAMEQSIVLEIEQGKDVKLETSYTLTKNPGCEGITGDLNGDGLIDELDIEVMQKMIVGSEEQSPCADIDKDGYVAPGDLSKLRNVIIDIGRFDVKLAPKVLDKCSINGDANNDGKIDYKDVGVIKHMIVGKLKMTLCGDTDGDGYVAPGDIMKTQNIIIEQERTKRCMDFSPPSSPKCSAILGDLNKDSFVNRDDMKLMIKMVKGNETPTDCADFDGNDVIDRADQVKLGRLILNVSYCRYSYNYTYEEDDSNQTGNETGDDQRDDNDDQGDDDADAGSSSGSSRHSTAVMYMPGLSATPNEDSETTMNVTEIPAEPDKNETQPEVIVAAGNDNTPIDPDFPMMGVMIALSFAGLGMTGRHVKEVLNC